MILDPCHSPAPSPPAVDLWPDTVPDAERASQVVREVIHAVDEPGGLYGLLFPALVERGIVHEERRPNHTVVGGRVEPLSAQNVDLLADTDGEIRDAFEGERLPRGGRPDYLRSRRRRSCRRVHRCRPGRPPGGRLVGMLDEGIVELDWCANSGVGWPVVVLWATKSGLSGGVPFAVGRS